MRETNLFSRCSVSARLSIRHAAITTPASSAIHLRVRGRTQQQTLGSMIAAAGHRSPCRISAPAHASAECPPIHLRPRATGHVSFETLIAPGATSRPRNDAVREKTAHRFSRAGWRCLLRQRRTTVSTDLFNYSFELELAHLGRSAKKMRVSGNSSARANLETVALALSRRRRKGVAERNQSCHG